MYKVQQIIPMPSKLPWAALDRFFELHAAATQLVDCHWSRVKTAEAFQIPDSKSEYFCSSSDTQQTGTNKHTTSVAVPIHSRQAQTNTQHL